MATKLVEKMDEMRMQEQDMIIKDKTRERDFLRSKVDQINAEFTKLDGQHTGITGQIKDGKPTE